MRNAEEKLIRAQQHAEDRRTRSEEERARIKREYEEMAEERRENEKQVEETKQEALEVERKVSHSFTMKLIIMSIAWLDARTYEEERS